jgi:hypothetical protein
LVSTPKQRGGVTGKGFLPGASGNPNGRARGDALMRRKLMQSFKANQKEAMAAMARRLDRLKGGVAVAMGTGPSRPGNRRGTGGTLPPEETRFKPGSSGNYAGRPAGDGLVRKLILEAFRQSRTKALEAIRRRLENPKYVQDVLELLARLDGELGKASGDDPRRVSVILLNNQGEHPLDPETFRQSVQRRVLEDQRRAGLSPPE